MCTFRKAIKNFEVKVDVQKGALRFKGKFDNKCVGFIQFKVLIHCCDMVIVLNDYAKHSS